MAIEVVKGPVYTRLFQVEAGTANSIKGGVPLKKDGAYVVAVANGDPEIGTDEFVGVSSSISTETADEDGTVEVRVISVGETILRGPASTPANLENNDYRGMSVTFDVSSGVYTIDEDEADDIDVHGLVIVDQDADRGTVDVMVKPEATIIGSKITQT